MQHKHELLKSGLYWHLFVDWIMNYLTQGKESCGIYPLVFNNSIVLAFKITDELTDN